ncbi:MAG TPA: potassium channel family protein [Pilimelia sp.]|nr:potassium channel family protein [Pilimelia sp.]
MKDLLLFLLLPLRVGYRALVWIANRPRALMLGYFALLIVSAALYSLFEDGKGIDDSIWWAVVTASTVGYGDTYPTTGAGRFVGAILILTMVMLVIPLITAHFASKLIVDQDAFRHEEQEEIKQSLRRLLVLTEELAARSEISAPDSASLPPAPAGRSDSG